VIIIHTTIATQVLSHLVAIIAFQHFIARRNYHVIPKTTDVRLRERLDLGRS